MSRHLHDVLEGFDILLADGFDAARPATARALTLAAEVALAGSGVCFRAWCRLHAAAGAVERGGGADQHGAQGKAHTASYHAFPGVKDGGPNG